MKKTFTAFMAAVVLMMILIIGCSKTPKKCIILIEDQDFIAHVMEASGLQEYLSKKNVVCPLPIMIKILGFPVEDKAGDGTVIKNVIYVGSWVNRRGFSMDVNIVRCDVIWVHMIYVDKDGHHHEISNNDDSSLLEIGKSMRDAIKRKRGE
jgi:hypothetical protein